MIRYRKGAEPGALAAHRATPGADWSGFGGKQEVREALVRDQRGICAYCQQFIDASPATKIEHWVARGDGPDGELKVLHWPNLLGVCAGVSGAVKHCDTYRGQLPLADQRLYLHPVEGQGPDPRDHLRYQANGTPYAHPPSAAVTRDIEILNLKCEYLRRGREQVIRDLERKLMKVGFTPRHIETRLRELDGTPTQFVEVARDYLRRKLRQVS